MRLKKQICKLSKRENGAIAAGATATRKRKTTKTRKTKTTKKRTAKRTTKKTTRKTTKRR